MRISTPGSMLTIISIVLSLFLHSCSQPSAPHATDLGRPCDVTVMTKLERAPLETLQIEGFLGGRNVSVLLPPGYSGSSESYPVLYMPDAQQLFCEFQTWFADRSIPFLIRSGRIRPIIVVGIESLEGLDRIVELAPWASRFQGQILEGNGEEYLVGIRDVLKPEIDGHYRTLPDRDNTYIAGASIAGLLAAYAGFVHDSTYSRIAAMSPSYGWGSNRILTLIGDNGKPNVDRYYHDMGTVDDNSISFMLAIEGLIIEQGLEPGVEIMSVVGEGHEHKPACWGRRLPAMLEFLIGPDLPAN